YALALRRVPASTSRRRLQIELGGLALLVVVSELWKLLVTAGMVTPLGFTPAIVALPVYLDVFALGMGLAVLHAWHAQGGTVPRPLRLLDRWPSLAWLVALGAFWVVSTRIGLNTIEGYTREQYMERHLLNALIGVAIVVPAVVG